MGGHNSKLPDTQATLYNPGRMRFALVTLCLQGKSLAWTRSWVGARVILEKRKAPGCRSHCSGLPPARHEYLDKWGCCLAPALCTLVDENACDVAVTCASLARRGWASFPLFESACRTSENCCSYLVGSVLLINTFAKVFLTILTCGLVHWIHVNLKEMMSLPDSVTLSETRDVFLFIQVYFDSFTNIKISNTGLGHFFLNRSLCDYIFYVAILYAVISFTTGANWSQHRNRKAINLFTVHLATLLNCQLNLYRCFPGVLRFSEF